MIGWQANYIIIAMMSFISLLLLIVKIPETKTEFRQFQLSCIFSDYQKLFFQRKFVITCIIPSLLYASYVAYFAPSSMLYIKMFGVSSMSYAIQQAIIIATFAVTSMSAGKILRVVGQKRMMKYGMGLCIVSCALLILSCLAFPKSPYLMTLLMSTYCIGFAMSYSVIVSESLDNDSRARGAASSIIMGMRAVLISTCTALTSYTYNNESITVALIVFLGVAVAFILSLNLSMSRRLAPCTR